MDARQRSVNLVNIGIGVLAAGVVLYILRWLSPMFALEAKIPQHDLVVSLFGIAVGIAAWWYANSATVARNFIGEVVSEVFKVTFPTKKEVKAATIVVTIFVLIIGGILGLFDSFLTWVFSLILGA